MARRPPPEINEFLGPFPPTVQQVAVRLRSRVLRVFPSAHETVWDATNAVSLAYSTTPRRGINLCHVAAYSRHVNLGFADGASLPDPLGKLHGTGARIRHATFRHVEDTAADWVDDYLRAALAFAGITESMGDGGTTVRVMQGPKRRPRAALAPPPFGVADARR